MRKKETGKIKIWAFPKGRAITTHSFVLHKCNNTKGVQTRRSIPNVPSHNPIVGILVLFLFFFAQIGTAQQEVQFSQYNFNYFAINPAMAGSKSCLQFALGYRKQWMNLKGAPATGFGSFTTALTPKRRSVNGTKHGIGMYVENDVIGPFARTSINLAYAYHFPMGRDITASVGIFAGIHQLKFDATKVTLNNSYDPLVSGSQNTLIVPDFSPGIFLKNKDWFAGYSIKQLAKNKWKVAGTKDTRSRWHHYLVGGKRFDAGKINLVPSAMLKYVWVTTPSLDLNLMVEFSKDFSVGIGWRNQDQIGAMFKLRFAKYLTLGYSFDYTTSSIRYGSSNTHELILVISACSHDRSTIYDCPIFN